MSMLKSFGSALLLLALVACGGGGGDPGTPVSAVAAVPSAGSSSPVSVASGANTSNPTAAVSSILLSAPSPLTISADGTSTSTITVQALDAANGRIRGATINLSTDGGTILGSSSVVTDKDTGVATVVLTADSSNQATRSATVRASCTACSAPSASLQFQVNGASMALVSAAGWSVAAEGSPLILSALVTDTKGTPVPGISVTFATSDSSRIGLTSAAATTNQNGIATISVKGLTAGSGMVMATALGNAKSVTITVTPAAALEFNTPATDTTMVTNVPKSFTVIAPGAATIHFSSTVGTFGVIEKNGNQFTSKLTSDQAGSVTVTATDDTGVSVSRVLYISPPVSAANRIIFSANQTTLKTSSTNSTPNVRLTARAIYSNGANDQPVANVPILFSMKGGPGSGEYLTPAYQLTDSTGSAYADFYSGTSSSIQNGISISAQIQGTAIATGTAPSSNPVQLTVGGQAMSVAFGRSSEIRSSVDKTLYIQDYSVQVTDSNNNPVANSVVTLRVRPVAFSTGDNCTVAASYCSEDANGNGSLDTNEDGARSSFETIGNCPAPNALPAAIAGKSDGLLTPQNSMGGSVPATVTTNESGTAPFTLTYLKSSAIWIVDKLSATVMANGTESGASTIFRLPALDADVSPKCLLPPSPFE